MQKTWNKRILFSYCFVMIFYLHFWHTMSRVFDFETHLRATVCSLYTFRGGFGIFWVCVFFTYHCQKIFENQKKKKANNNYLFFANNCTTASAFICLFTSVANCLSFTKFRTLGIRRHCFFVCHREQKQNMCNFDQE